MRLWDTTCFSALRIRIVLHVKCSTSKNNQTLSDVNGLLSSLEYIKLGVIVASDVASSQMRDKPRE
jgi:hypothetical protein